MKSLRNLVTVWTLLLTVACTVYHHGPQTDHFDGTQFHNPPPMESHGFMKVLRLAISRHRVQWPQWVEFAYEGTLPTNVSPRQAAVTFINHATCLVQLPHLTLITDPVYAHRASPVTWAGPARVHPPGIPWDRLPKIDVVLISHDHYDHFDVATLKKLQQTWDPLFITGLGNQKRLQAIGISKVVALDWWEEHSTPEGLQVTFTPAKHFSGRGLFDRDKTLWGSFVIEAEGLRLYFAGDTAYSPHFRAIAEKLGPIDCAMLPIGSYQPRWFMQPVHVDPEEAVQAHIDLEARQSIGIHFGTFQLSEEAYDQPAVDLRAAQQKLGVVESCFVVPQWGQTFWVEEMPH